MNKEQLWETTMDPARRTLVRINVEDAIEADNVKSSILMCEPSTSASVIIIILS